MLCSLKLKIKIVSWFFSFFLIFYGMVQAGIMHLYFVKLDLHQNWKISLKENVVISDDTRVTAVTKTRDYARNFSLDFSVKTHLCFCLGTSWPSLSSSWCPCRIGCWFLLNGFRCSLTEWSWRLTCTLVRVFGHGCAVYGYLVCCKVPGKPQCFDNMCQKAEPVMALSCFISPSRLAICSLRSSCSYT